MSLEILHDNVCASGLKGLDARGACGNRDRSGPRRSGAGDIQHRISDNQHVARLHFWRTAREGSGHRNREQIIQIHDIVSVCAAPEEFPEIRMLELDACAPFAVTGEQRVKYILARGKRPRRGGRREERLYWGLVPGSASISRSK